MSGEKLVVTDDHRALAEEKLKHSAWAALPRELLDDCEGMRQLSDAAFRAAIRLLNWQWRHGSVPSDPNAAARNVSVRAAAARDALSIFTDRLGAVARQPDLARERHKSIEKLALAIAKGSAGGTKAAGNPSPAGSPASSPATSGGDTPNPTNYVVGDADPPDGVAERGRTVKAAALAAVDQGLVVTPLVFGQKAPSRGRRQVWLSTVAEVEASWPTGPANLGYQPGQSGVLEVDIDDAAGEALAMSLGCLAEPTFTVQTPRALLPDGHPKKFAGAIRLRFLLPPDLMFGKIGLLGVLEVFGTSGHVLLPPSWFTEYGAGYVVVDESPPLPCPPKLEAALREVIASRERPTAGAGSGKRNATALLNALERVTGQRPALRPGRGTMVRCPAHADSTPSLSLSIGADGAPVFRCQAGCPAAAVLAALGVSWADFYGEAA